MHSAQCCTAPSATQRPALHRAQRFTAHNASLPALYSAQHCTPPSQEEAERSGKRGYCAAFNEALPMQQRLETLHKVCALACAFSAAHIKRAPLHSAQRYTVRSATQCAAMHSAQRCTAPSATLRPALHCAQRFTASVAQCATLYIRPPPPSSTAQRAALHSAQHCTAPSTASQDKADRSKRAKHIQRAALHSAQRCTVSSATQRYTAPSASLRPALHCAQRYTAPSATLRAALQVRSIVHPPLPSAA